MRVLEISTVVETSVGARASSHFWACSSGSFEAAVGVLLKTVDVYCWSNAPFSIKHPQFAGAVKLYMSCNLSNISLPQALDHTLLRVPARRSFFTLASLFPNHHSPGITRSC